MRIKILTLLLLICILLVAWTEFKIFPHILIQYKDANKINNLITTMSLAYIISYAFYFIVVYIKEIRDKKNSKEFIIQNCKKIISIGTGLKEKTKEYNINRSIDFFNDEELKNIFKKIPISSEVFNHRRLYKFTWEEYLKEISKETRYTIDRIFVLSSYLESKFVVILNKLYNSNFLDFPNKTVPVSLIEKKRIPINMSMYSSMIIEYFKILNAIEEFIKKYK